MFVWGLWNLCITVSLVKKQQKTTTESIFTVVGEEQLLPLSGLLYANSFKKNLYAIVITIYYSWIRMYVINRPFVLGFLFKSLCSFPNNTTIINLVK